MVKFGLQFQQFAACWQRCPARQSFPFVSELCDLCIMNNLEFGYFSSSLSSSPDVLFSFFFLLLLTRRFIHANTLFRLNKLEWLRGSIGKLSSLPVTTIHTDTQLFSMLVNVVGLLDRFISSYPVWLTLISFTGQASTGFFKNSGPFHHLSQCLRSAAIIPLLSILAGFKLVGIYFHCSGLVLV